MGGRVGDLGRLQPLPRAQVRRVPVRLHPRREALRVPQARQQRERDAARLDGPARPRVRPARPLRLRPGPLRGEVGRDGRGEDGRRGDGVGAADGLAVPLREGLAAHDVLVFLEEVGGLGPEEALDAGRAAADPGDATNHVGVVVDVALEVLEQRPAAEDREGVLPSPRRVDVPPGVADRAEGGARVRGPAHADRDARVRETPAARALLFVVGAAAQARDLLREQASEDPERVDGALEQRELDEERGPLVAPAEPLLAHQRAERARHAPDGVAGRVRLAPELAPVGLRVESEDPRLEPLRIARLRPGSIPSRRRLDRVAAVLQVVPDLSVHATSSSCLSMGGLWQRFRKKVLQNDYTGLGRLQNDYIQVQPGRPGGFGLRFGTVRGEVAWERPGGPRGFGLRFGAVRGEVSGGRTG